MTSLARKIMYTQNYKTYTTILLLVIYVFNQMDRAIFGILMEPIKNEMRLSDTALGFLAGPALALFYGLLGIPIARWADRSHRVNIMSGAVLLWSAVVALTSSVQTFWHFALARIGVGVGEAGFSAVAQSVIGDYHTAKERTRALAIFMLGLPIGQAASYVVGGWINEAWGWRAAFIVAGVSGVILAPLLKWTVREPHRAQSRKSGAREISHPSMREVMGTIWQCRALRHLTVAMTLGALMLGVLGWKAAFFIRVHGMSTGELGSWMAIVMGVGGALGVWLSGRTFSLLKVQEDERAQTILIAVSAVVTCAFLIAALSWPSSAGALLMLLLAFGALNFFFAPSFSLVQGLSPASMRATVVAVIILFQLLFSGVVGWQLTGILSDAFASKFRSESLRWAMISLSPASLWAAVHFLLAGRSIREDLDRMASSAGLASKESHQLLT